jgi:arylsulfatase A-like enzyme
MIITMNRTHFVSGRHLACLLGFFLATTLSLPAQTATNEPPPNPRRPNILLVIADGLGYGDLGCYGQRNIKTPNLDRLATEGVRFTSFYAGSPVSAVSRATLLLGLDAGHLGGTDDSVVTLPVGAPTVAEMLKAAGYRTAYVGEWLLGDNSSVNVPQKRGFDEWAGLLTAAEAQTDFPPYVWRYDPPGNGKELYDGKVEFGQNRNGLKGKSASDLFTTAATNFIIYSKPDHFNRQRPFFLCLAYALPRVCDLDSAEPYELEGWPKAQEFQAAAVTKLDADIGKILDRLKQFKQESNTIVIVTSASGPPVTSATDLKFHRRTGPLSSGTLGEGDLRVPLIVWGPSKIKAGDENYLPCAAWDLLPTLAEIARAQLPDKTDGLSFLPPLQGLPQLRRHEFLYWQTATTNGLAQAVRVDDWKAVRSAPGAPLELYSLTADRAETANVATNHPDLVAKIEKYLKTR